MIDVVWVGYPADGKNINRGYWDQGMLEEVLAGSVWRPPTWPDFAHHETFDAVAEGAGGVVVLAARFHHGDAARLNADMARLPWVLLILASDEESVFPWEDVHHPKMLVWLMTPRPDRHHQRGAGGDGPPTVSKFIGEGYPPWARQILATIPADRPQPASWFLSGTNAHERRNECFAAAKRLKGGIANATLGFTQGYDHESYIKLLAQSKVALCPSGPATPDSFRFFEALEAGCVPLADGFSPALPTPGYWEQLFGTVPFPVVDDWSELPRLLNETLAEWPANANRLSAWWQQYKRGYTHHLISDLRRLGAPIKASMQFDDIVTVLISTSPVPSNPSLDIITETVESIRERLPRCEIIVMADGVRPEQEDRRPAYDEYLRRLVWATNHQWSNVVPMISPHHVHQANLTREALGMVTTPLIMFVEHDTPLIGGPVDWQGIARAILDNKANLVRLHHETHVLDVHQYLMLDTKPQDVSGVPMMRTIQWSQRPHVASFFFYEKILNRYFPPASRTMIEDRLVGVLEEAGKRGWDDWRLWMYTPEGSFQRSTHLNGRADDPKYDMQFGL